MLQSKVLGNGGQQGSGSGYSIVGTVGQPIVGSMSNGVHLNGSGFWYGTAAAQLSLGNVLVENFNYGVIANSDITAISSWSRHSGAQGPA